MFCAKNKIEKKNEDEEDQTATLLLRVGLIFPNPKKPGLKKIREKNPKCFFKNPFFLIALI